MVNKCRGLNNRQASWLGIRGIGAVEEKSKGKNPVAGWGGRWVGGGATMLNQKQSRVAGTKSLLMKNKGKKNITRRGGPAHPENWPRKAKHRHSGILLNKSTRSPNKEKNKKNREGVKQRPVGLEIPYTKKKGSPKKKKKRNKHTWKHAKTVASSNALNKLNRWALFNK